MNETKNCIICGKPGEINFRLGSYSVLFCKNCKYRWIPQHFNEEVLVENEYYWGKEFFQKYEIYLRALWRQEIALIKRYAGAQQADWLDIGCSFGYLISEAKKQGFNVTGIEASGEVVRLATQREDLNIKHSLINNFDITKGSFDIITMFDVLEHLQYPSEAVKKVTSWARPGGLLVIEVPNDNSLFRKMAYLIYRLSLGRIPYFVKTCFNEHPGGHRLGFSEYALKSFLDSQGWEIIAVKKTMMPFRFFFFEATRPKNIIKKIVLSSTATLSYLASIALGMQTRIKVYARKK